MKTTKRRKLREFEKSQPALTPLEWTIFVSLLIMCFTAIGIILWNLL
jgi:hypothetical protein